MFLCALFLCLAFGGANSEDSEIKFTETRSNFVVKGHRSTNAQAADYCKNTYGGDLLDVTDNHHNSEQYLKETNLKLEETESREMWVGGRTDIPANKMVVAETSIPHITGAQCVIFSSHGGFRGRKYHFWSKSCDDFKNDFICSVQGVRLEDSVSGVQFSIGNQQFFVSKNKGNYKQAQKYCSDRKGSIFAVISQGNVSAISKRFDSINPTFAKSEMWIEAGKEQCQILSNYKRANSAQTFSEFDKDCKEKDKYALCSKQDNSVVKYAEHHSNFLVTGTKRTNKLAVENCYSAYKGKLLDTSEKQYHSSQYLDQVSQILEKSKAKEVWVNGRTDLPPNKMIDLKKSRPSTSGAQCLVFSAYGDHTRKYNLWSKSCDDMKHGSICIVPGYIDMDESSTKKEKAQPPTQDELGLVKRIGSKLTALKKMFADYKKTMYLAKNLRLLGSDIRTYGKVYYVATREYWDLGIDRNYAELKRDIGIKSKSGNAKTLDSYATKMIKEFSKKRDSLDQILLKRSAAAKSKSTRRKPTSNGRNPPRRLSARKRNYRKVFADKRSYNAA